MASYRASLGLVGRSQTSFGSNILVHCTAYPLSPTANVMGRSSFSLPHTRPAHSASFPLASLVYGYIEMTAAAAAACIQPPPHNRTNERTNELSFIAPPSTKLHFPPPPLALPRPPARLPICRPNEKRSTAATALRSFISWFILSLSLSFLLPSFDASASVRLFRRRHRRDDAAAAAAAVAAASR